MIRNKTATIGEYHLNRHQPDKTQFAIYDLNAYINQNLGNTDRPHTHSYFQIIWFQTGRGRHFVDFESYDVISGSIFLIRNNQVHYFDSNTNYTGWLIHFNESFLFEKEWIAGLFFNHLVNAPNSSPFYVGDENHITMLSAYIALMKTEFIGDSDVGRDELLRSYLVGFLIQIIRLRNGGVNVHSDSIFSPNEKRLQLLRFTNLVNENYNKWLSVSDYSSLLFISTRTLTDLTSQLLNKTPSQLIQERIILQAQRLLAHSTLNVKQIAYELGFQDPSYFIKYFKRHLKHSPSDFRKSIS